MIELLFFIFEHLKTHKNIKLWVLTDDGDNIYSTHRKPWQVDRAAQEPGSPRTRPW